MTTTVLRDVLVHSLKEQEIMVKIVSEEANKHHLEAESSSRWCRLAFSLTTFAIFSCFFSDCTKIIKSDVYAAEYFSTYEIFVPPGDKMAAIQSLGLNQALLLDHFSLKLICLLIFTCLFGV